MSETKDTILDNKMLAEGFAEVFWVNKTWKFLHISEARVQIRKSFTLTVLYF